jgi:hypothetical protein
VTPWMKPWGGKWPGRGGMGEGWAKARSGGGFKQKDVAGAAQSTAAGHAPNAAGPVKAAGKRTSSVSCTLPNSQGLSSAQ